MYVYVWVIINDYILLSKIRLIERRDDCWCGVVCVCMCGWVIIVNLLFLLFMLWLLLLLLLLLLLTSHCIFLENSIMSDALFKF